MRSASRFLAAAVIALPLFASAQNVQDLQAQAQALLDRISALQQQLGNSGGTPGATLTTASSVACPQLGKSLKRGSSGEDVRRLQVFLSNDPSVYPEGQITGYYGALTEAAVKRWQVKFNIVSTGTAETTGFGVVGPRTAAVLALQCAGTASASGGVSGGNTPTVGGFIQVTPISGTAPLSVAVQVTVNTVNSCLGANYTLDYGDGTVPNTIAVPAGACQQQTQTLGHRYVYGGTYLITLSSGIHRTSASVLVYGPTGYQSGVPLSGQTITPTQRDSVTASPSSGSAPLSVSFSGVINGTQSCGGGTYTLAFGDGQSVPLTFDTSTCAARTFTVAHQYAAGGNYTAQLFSSAGTSGSVAAFASVSVSGAKAASLTPLTVTPGVGGNPLAVSAQFNLITACDAYDLDWGDGGAHAVVAAGTGTCTSSVLVQTLSHAYALDGTYTLTLKRGTRTDTAAISISSI